MKTIVFLDDIPPDQIRVETETLKKTSINNALDAIFFTAHGYRPVSSFDHVMCRSDPGVLTGNEKYRKYVKE
jgi:hypothetical protein